jgi:hypothetical protein
MGNPVFKYGVFRSITDVYWENGGKTVHPVRMMAGFETACKKSQDGRDSRPPRRGPLLTGRNISQASRCAAGWLAISPMMIAFARLADDLAVGRPIGSQRGSPFAS